VILKFGISGLNGLLNSMCIIQQGSIEQI